MRWSIEPYFKAHDPKPTEHDIENLEQAIGVRLPQQFRDFLLENGGGYICDGIAECTEVSTFGKMNITELHNPKEIFCFLDSAVMPRNMIAIGFGHFGMTTCLSIAGIDHGQVFALDTEMRHYTWDNTVLSKYSGLAPSVIEYFRLRDADELPEKPWGYENCFHVADSFDEFWSKLAPANPENKY